jgi:hypothetical protein
MNEEVDPLSRRALASTDVPSAAKYKNAAGHKERT